MVKERVSSGAVRATWKDQPAAQRGVATRVDSQRQQPDSLTDKLPGNRILVRARHAAQAGGMFRPCPEIDGTLQTVGDGWVLPNVPTLHQVAKAVDGCIATEAGKKAGEQDACSNSTRQQVALAWVERPQQSRRCSRKRG